MVMRLASQFSRLGPAPRVAICGRKGPEIYAAMLAALAAGGFYVPVNREAGSGRIETVMREVMPNVVFADDPGQAVIAAIAPQSRFLPFSAAREGNEELTENITPHRLAYVMYTSGSTGNPKGVMIPQSALDHYAGWAIAAMAMTPADQMSQHPNIGFDLSVLDIYATLCVGATLCRLTASLTGSFPHVPLPATN